MSILIHMEMPKDCECIVIQSDGTAYKYNPGDVVMYGDAYNETAVVIELQPHGRLIDADALKIYQMEENVRADGDPNEYEYDAGLIDGLHIAAKDVSAAPTIIPAEGGDADAR